MPKKILGAIVDHLSGNQRSRKRERERKKPKLKHNSYTLNTNDFFFLATQIHKTCESNSVVRFNGMYEKKNWTYIRSRTHNAFTRTLSKSSTNKKDLIGIETVTFQLIHTSILLFIAANVCARPGPAKWLFLLFVDIHSFFCFFFFHF